jgi:glycosyltransferase involved in cell wall biosynthesis
MESSRRDRSGSLAESYPFSVIIPAHNAARFLPETLEALAGNDLRNAEVLLVNDASSDNTIEVAQRFEASLNLKVVASATQSGPAGARNLGTLEASAPFLLFLDADVVLPSKALFWIRETLDLYSHREDVAGVLGAYSEDAPGVGFLTHFKNLSTTYLYKITETQSPFLHTAIFAVKREILELAGGFDVRLDRAEDFMLGVNLGSRGYRFIIDRRLEARHLKQYSMRDILVEDWQRIQNLRRIRFSGKERRFSLKAHRWSRLISLAGPGLVTVSVCLSFVKPESLWVALALILVFLVANLRFGFYLVEKRGIWFGLGSLLFLFLEMFWASQAVHASFLKGWSEKTTKTPAH